MITVMSTYPEYSLVSTKKLLHQNKYINTRKQMMQHFQCVTLTNAKADVQAVFSKLSRFKVSVVWYLPQHKWTELYVYPAKKEMHHQDIRK